MIAASVENTNRRWGGALARPAIIALALIAAAAGLGMVRSAGAADSGIVDGFGLAKRGDILRVELRKGRLVRLRRAAATVFVANPKIADIQVKSPTLLFVFGKRPGETTLVAVDAKDRLQLNLNLVVTHNLSGLTRALDSLIPNNRIKAQSAGLSLVLSGTVPTIEQAQDAFRLASQFAGKKRIINRLRVNGPNQINLRVRIVEMSRSIVRDLGVNWDSAHIVGENIVLGVFTGGAPAAGAILAPGAGTLLGGNVNARTAAGGGTVNNLFSQFTNTANTVNNLIDLLEVEGLAKTLAEPNLTAISGESASFLAGGEFPIVVPQSDGAFAVSFKQFGVSLAFTPTIVNTNRINIRVKPEVSQLASAGSVSFNGFVVPALTTRRADTTVELASGQSFAIAGLLQHTSNHDISKVPGLGDIPILGHLFRSDNFRRDETELVIVITPLIVKPFSTPIAARSGAGGQRLGASARIFLGPKLGRQANQHAMAPDAVPRRLMGPAGFVLE